jgi:MFS family permease
VPLPKSKSADASEAALRRNATLDLISAGAWGAALGPTAALVPAVAREAGMDVAALGVLAAAPYLASLLSMIAGRVGAHTGRQLAILRAGGAGVLATVPFLPLGLLPVVTFIFYLAHSIAAPAQVRLWTLIYPPRTRGRWIGRARMVQSGVAAGAAVVGGALADRVGGLWVVAAGGVLAAIGALSYAVIRADVEDVVRYTPLTSLRVLARQPLLRGLASAQLVSGVGQLAVVIVVPLVQIDRLGLSLAEIGGMGLATAIVTTLMYPVCAPAIDRWGGVVAMTAAGVLSVALPVCYAVATNSTPLWVCAVLIGVANAAFDLGLTALVAEQVAPVEQAACIAGWNTVMGFRGIVTALAVGGALGAGWLNTAALLQLSVAITVLGAVLFVGTARGVGWHRSRLGLVPGTSR